MISNPLIKIPELGQSIWYDNISRHIIDSGELRRMLIDDGIRGVTSNPTIFQNAISSGYEYDELIKQLLSENKNLTVADLYEKLIINDIKDGADILRSVYDDTNGLDGYISVEVSPDLAYKTDETIFEAIKLWNLIDRPNLMIKVPATKEGIAAVRQLIRQGINVNITLMFSMQHYVDVVEAYLSGLEDRLANVGNLETIASVASFFVSRVDTMVDKKLAEMGNDNLKGKIAVANSKIVYQKSLEICSSDRFKKLESAGAKKQRLLWASTGTKNPNYSDVLYIEELLGMDTVNTVPPATLNAFRDHGIPEESLTKNIEQSEKYLVDLKNSGVNLDEITHQLQLDGVEAFANSFKSLMEVLSQKQSTILKIMK
jgi:transaldolase / glucose-6-phosphate isomerase